MRAAVVLVAAALALAALTLLAPSSPSYDPFAWIVWGRELMPGAGGPPFGLAGGPSWKPLPVLFTAPFSLAGDAAPALWLLVARAGLLLALAGAYRLGARLAGVGAGVLSAVFLLLLEDLLSLAWRGASEPLLLACLLWAIERHIAGRRTVAYALGVAAALIRPEVVPFLALYAAIRWRSDSTRERVVLVAGLALVVALWIGLPGLAGDPLAASSTAQTDATAQPSAFTALRRGLALPLLLVWPLAAAALLLRPRDRTLRALGLGAAAWIALVVAMTAAGYAGVARYMLPAGAIVCVLAGVGAAALTALVGSARDRRVTALAAVIGVAAVVLTLPRAARLDDQVREGTAVARAHDALLDAVDRSGGAAAMRRCALGGWVAVNHTTGSALAWELRVSLDRVARTMSRPGLLVRAPRSAATGGPPAVTLDAPPHRERIVQAGPWEVLAVHAAGGPFPPACERRKASGSRRRIPNI